LIIRARPGTDLAQYACRGIWLAATFAGLTTSGWDGSYQISGADIVTSTRYGKGLFFRFLSFFCEFYSSDLSRFPAGAHLAF
jgi:hypothetical protein